MNVHDSSASANRSRPEDERRERLDLLRAEQRVDAVIDVDAAADEEDADRRDERPEELLLAAAERMHAVGPAAPRTSPTLSSTWLPTSASEWMVSAKSVGEPVTNQPKPLAAAIAVLVAIERVTDEDTRGEG